MAKAIAGVLHYEKTKWVPLVTNQGKVESINAGVSVETLSGLKSTLERELTPEELQEATWDLAGFDGVIKKLAEECYALLITPAEPEPTVEVGQPATKEDEIHLSDLGVDEISLQRDIDSGVR